MHERIDQAIEAAHKGPLAPISSDAEFLRRAYLDLVGMIPSARVAREFLDDRSLEKRPRLIDRLLSSPEFARYMQTFLDVTLMERRRDKHVKSAEWQEYLRKSLLADKPYDRLAHEILAGDGDDAASSPAAKFYLDREGELHRVTRDIGRLFFGIDVQCAQCHDHPLIDDYLQSDYYGLYAFVNRSYVFTAKKKKKVFFAEKATGDVSYKSVFDPDTSYSAKPRLPGGKAVEEPEFEKGKEYNVAPAKDVRPVPKYSRREQLARLATDGTNAMFNRNIVNRLWAFLMGRGLVHPPDLHHGDNPPSHPQLLATLSRDFAAMNYDIKAFLRELALTRAYQRSTEIPVIEPDPERARKQLQASRREHERLAARARAAADAALPVVSDLAAARKAAGEVAVEAQRAKAASATAGKEVETASSALAAAQRELAERESAARLLAEARAKAAGAAAKLSGDKVLEEAVAKISERTEELSRDISRRRKLVGEQAALLETAREKVAAAEKAREKATARLVAARRPVEELEPDAEKREAVRAVERDAAMEALVALKSAEALEKCSRLVAGANRAAEQEMAALAKSWRRHFAVSTLKPLSPEQLAWSLMQATGIVERERSKIDEDLKKTQSGKKAKDNKQAGTVPDQDGVERRIERAVHEKLRGNVTQFISLFGGSPGEPPQDFQATVQQALFFANGEEIRKWLKPGSGNLTDRLLGIEDPTALAEELYLSVLTRRPTQEESAEVGEYLAAHGKQRAEAVQSMIWALLTSVEFRFNH